MALLHLVQLGLLLWCQMRGELLVRLGDGFRNAAATVGAYVLQLFGHPVENWVHLLKLLWREIQLMLKPLAHALCHARAMAPRKCVVRVPGAA